LVVFGCLAFAGCSSEDPVVEAKALLEEGRARAAVELLEVVVLEQNDNLEAAYLYGVALTATGESGLAEWSLRRAMAAPEYRTSAGLMVVNNALRGQNPMEAVKLLTEMLEDDPDNVEFLLARASAYAKTRINLEDVQADVARARELDPDNLDAFRPEILGYLSAVMEEEAATALEALGARLEQEEEGQEGIAMWYCTTMALFAMESGEKELARDRFGACLDAHPSDPQTVVAATDFHREVGEVDRAIEVLEAAIEAWDAPADPGFAPRLAQLLYEQGRAEEAEAVLVAASDSDNLNTRLAYTLQLSQFYEQQGRIGESLDRFEEGVGLMSEIGTPTGSAHFSLADLAIRAGALDRAEEIATRIEHPPFRSMIEARVAQERGEHVAAMQIFAEAARLWPDNEFARYHAARSAEQLGRFDEAMELYRHATRISVTSTNAMTRIAILLYASGNPGEAYNVLRTQRSRAPLDELGELLKMELMVTLDGPAQVPQVLSAIPRTDPIGAAARFGPVFRALRLRNEPAKAFELAVRADPRVFAQEGGDFALDELARTVGGDPVALGRVDAILAVAMEHRPDDAGLAAVKALLLEFGGATDEEIALAYAAALELDDGNPLALLGRARRIADSNPDEAVTLATRSLGGIGLRNDRVLAIARRLIAVDAQAEAVALCERLIEHAPFDGGAAFVLAEDRVAAGDHGDRTLDLARRAVRFARSPRSLELLREVRSKRGELPAEVPRSTVEGEVAAAAPAESDGD